MSMMKDYQADWLLRNDLTVRPLETAKLWVQPANGGYSFAASNSFTGAIWSCNTGKRISTLELVARGFSSKYRYMIDGPYMISSDTEGWQLFMILHGNDTAKLAALVDDLTTLVRADAIKLGEQKAQAAMREALGMSSNY